MFSRFRILCALRRGPYGVTEINRLCERILLAERLIRTAGPRCANTFMSHYGLYCASPMKPSD